MNEQRAEYIKRQKEEAKARLEQERQTKLIQYQRDYENRVAEEEMLRARTEALVAKMEKEEMELIARLENPGHPARGHPQQGRGEGEGEALKSERVKWRR